MDRVVSRQQSDFYLTVTSDNNAALFKNNKASDFRVRLAHQLFLEHKKWKVGLSALHYPYEFSNIGENTFIKIYHAGEIRTINLPQGFCDTLGDFTPYLTEVINQAILDIIRKQSDEKTNTIIQASKRDRRSVSIFPLNLFESPSFQMLEAIESLDSMEKRMKQFQDSLDKAQQVYNKTKYEEKKEQIDSEVVEHSSIHKDSNHEQFDNSVNKKTAHTDNAETVHSENSDQTRNRNEYIFSIETLSLRRIKIKCNINDFDIAFSDQLLKILGLTDHPELYIAAFDYRDKIRESFISAFESFSHFSKSDAIKLFHFYLKYLHDIKQRGREFDLQFATDLLLRVFTTPLRIISTNLLWHENTALSHILSTDRQQFPANWVDESSFWKDYITQDEYNKIKQLSQLRDQTGYSPLDPDNFQSYSDNLETLITLTFMCKLSDSIPLFKTVHGNLPGHIIPFEMLYIYSDLIVPEPFNAIMSPLLAIVKNEGVAGTISTYSPSTIQYKSVDKVDISNFKILIASNQGEPVPFLRGPAVVTLHFVPANK